MHVPSVVEIIEVGLRDGLQNEAVIAKSFAHIHRRNLISQGLLPLTFAIESDGPQSIKTELATLIASEEVADRVKIIPSVPYKELLAWTGSADIGLIIYSPNYSPNVSMCLPNKLFEYMMAGLPILASQLEAVADIINSFCVGHVLSSLEPYTIAQAINRMLADSAALQQMQHNALSIAQSDFCWEKEQKQLLQLYHTILATSIQ